MRSDWPAAYAAMHANGEAAWPPACMYYVLEGVRAAARRAPDGALTPEQVVEDFRARVRTDFGALAAEVLDDWDLKTPARLGEAVLLLGKHGALTLGPSDTAEAFAADMRPLFGEEEAA